MTRTFITVLALLAAAAPASAARYSGTTDGGEPVSFDLRNGVVRNLDALVPTSCVNTDGDPPRAGAEIFAPPGAFRIGAERKVSALQEPAMHYSEVTKNYRVAVKRTRGGLRLKLHVNFSFQTIDYSGSSPSLMGWVCQGDDTVRVLG